MLSVHDNPTFEGSTEIKFPKSPARSSDGSTSPPSLLFSWSRMRAEQGEGGGGEEDDLSSPPLWRPGFSMSNPSHPMSLRAQEIARGRQELMKLYEGMPESAYELSLKDLVDQKAAMDQLKQKQQGNPDEPKITNKGINKKKRPPRHGRKKNNYPASFLLNIFVPSSFTVRPHTSSRPLSPNSSQKNNDQSGKNSSKSVAHPMQHKNTLMSLLRIRPSKGSEMSRSNSFNKVSPRPYSGKDGQPDVPIMSSHIEAKSNNSSRCAKCSGYTVFFKTNCQACDKVYCSNCSKEAIANTPEGRRCRTTCADRLYDDSDSEPQMKSCWPILSSNKIKSGRRTKYSLREEEKETL